MGDELRRMCALLILAGAWSQAAFAEDSFDEVRQEIRQRMAELGVPGMAVAVWEDGRTVWEEGFGWADRENRVPASQHTLFSLASVSKPLTAVGVMTLVQAGRIDLDRPINDYLGTDRLVSKVGNPRGATVRRVMNHTSGLPAKTEFYYGDERRLMPTMAQNIARYGILAAPAGERFAYSNLGYGVLGHLLARVSGKSYADFMHEAVFRPLGMDNTSVDIGPGHERHHAIRYDREGRPIPFIGIAEPGSAAVYSSAHDLARFGSFLVGCLVSGQRRILDEPAIAEMTREPVGEPGVGAGPYALGWSIGSGGGHRLVEHGGGISGVSTRLTLVPDRALVVVVLANAENAPVVPIRNAIFRLRLPGWTPPAPLPPAAPRPAFEPGAALTGVWEGTIQTPEQVIPMRLRIRSSGDVHLWIHGDGRWRAANRMESVLSEVAFADGELTGKALSQIETAQTQRERHTVSLALKLRGEVLNGTVSAVSSHPRYWVYGLPYWTELKKTGPEGG